MDEGEGSGSVGMYVGLEEEEGSAEHSLTSVNADGWGGMDRGGVGGGGYLSGCGFGRGVPMHIYVLWSWSMWSEWLPNPKWWTWRRSTRVLPRAV